jgi:LAGLIDADG-like domain
MGHPPEIIREIRTSTPRELTAYVAGAARDGHISRTHGTLRIAQAGRDWLEVLQVALLELDRRSWIYEEGRRGVFVLETSFLPMDPPKSSARSNHLAFARGYFDAEGGIPRAPEARFYIQFVQKDRHDLATVRRFLTQSKIHCGRVHNPSRRVDPNYWRFYVATCCHPLFLPTVGSWHPRKRRLLEARRDALGKEVLDEGRRP